VAGVFAAASAEFTEFEPFRRGLFIFRRDVVSIFTVRTLKNDVIARHNSPLNNNK
jgi:hypothetical protein